ncbi:PREDICTED: tumor necrosis factor receptor superfamily member 16 [Myotis davidii]|uniref:tumor necrosis factor receptor superfamily member 16 n=1 Tax=Myotis davidii TaxID=225400 RepID=UPI00076732A0|nr:PREDICTED: tumor necrosis factor receptor superfamily member 16 [Myotis davidii]
MTVVMVVLVLVSFGSAQEACLTGLYTHSGECCKACYLGEGVARPCGANQTVCEPCLDSHSCHIWLTTGTGQVADKQLGSGHCDHSSERLPELEKGLEDQELGPFEWEVKTDPLGTRAPGVGWGLETQITKGRAEGNGRSILSPSLPEIPGRWATRATPPEGSDSTVPSTQEPEVPPDQDLVASTVADVVTTVMGSSQPVVTRGSNDNLIPVYCSILAAVVVGLVAYIAFKRWNSCKQNKQGANSRPVNQTPPPEGEKLHSDSGISVDSQSLHDQQPHTQTAAGQALKGDGGLYSSLPPAKREEVEKLLNGSAGDTWRHLADELGYQPEHIDSFTHEACPVRALLASWAAQDSATLDALLAALRRIQRADIVESLCSESTATSPV